MSPEEAEARYDAWAAVHPADYAALLNPGVRETVAELKGLGVRVALASSSPMDNIMHVLEVCGLSDAFEHVTSGEQFLESKPNPEIYLHTLDLLGLPATSCCCVEDSVPGIAAGKARSASCGPGARHHQPGNPGDRFGFSQELADAVVDSIADILALSASR